MLINSVENHFNLLPVEQYFFYFVSFAVFMTQRCQWTYFVVKNTWLHLSHFARERRKKKKKRKKEGGAMCNFVGWLQVAVRYKSKKQGTLERVKKAHPLASQFEGTLHPVESTVNNFYFNYANTHSLKLQQFLSPLPI